MKIEKLPSGSYRVRKTINKKTYTLVFDHYPSEKDILLKMSEKIDNVISAEHIPFEVAAKEYCKLKKNVISPSTYRDYINFPKRLSDAFNALYIDQITQLDIQLEVNNLSATRKPKTVKNIHSFIASVINMYRPDFNIRTTLPKGIPATKHLPTTKEVNKIKEFSKTYRNGKYYVPFILACYGMRRSEVCALLPSDIKDNTAYITKAKVINSDNNWVIKPMPKTVRSARAVPIPADVAQIIEKQGFVYNGDPSSISDFIVLACDKLGIERFSMHTLRHYFCSKLSADNVDVETIQALGGWETDSAVMRNNYRHQIDSKVKKASGKLNKILFN